MIEWFFVAAGIIATARAIAGPTFADRMIAIDAVITVIVFMMVLKSVELGAEIYLDIAIVFMLLSFVGTLAVAKFVKPRESKEVAE